MYKDRQLALYKRLLAHRGHLIDLKHYGERELLAVHMTAFNDVYIEFKAWGQIHKVKTEQMIKCTCPMDKPILNEAEMPKSIYYLR